jgi:hypothetical protein
MGVAVPAEPVHVERAERAMSAATQPEAKRHQLADALARDLAPIDWPAFWAEESPDEEWVVEQIVPAGRQVAIFSPAKAGKSLLAVDLAAATATGRSVLGRPAGPPRSVIYLDLEMTPTDLRERLSDLGYGPDDDLSKLAYYQLPSLPALDTDRGGQVLEALARRHAAELAVIDTMARAVDGAEDDADTYRAFYTHTGVRLKRMGVALLRLDHAGKDIGKGQRGSSGKADDVDVVFRLGIVEGCVVLTRTHSRIPWVPAEVTLRRELEPNLRHVLTDGGWPAGVADVARLLDQLGIPLDATTAGAVRTLKLAEKPRRRQLVGAALRFRRERDSTSKTVPENLGTGRAGESRELSGTGAAGRTHPQVKRSGTVPGTAGNGSASDTGTPFSPIRGTGPGTSPGTDDGAPGLSDDDLDSLFAVGDDHDA